LAEHVVRRAAQGVLVAQHRVAPVGSPARPGCGGCWWPRSARRRAGGCWPGCPRRSWGSGCRRRGGCLAQLHRRRGRCGSPIVHGSERHTGTVGTRRRTGPRASCRP
jgi:hypothetical protein